LHAALEVWFDGTDWWPADTAALDRLLVERMEWYHVAHSSSAAKMLRARLRRRAGALAAWVRDRGVPEPEVELKDVGLRASGRADLVIVSEGEYALVDIKTGQWKRWQVEVQLALYAKLLEPLHGRLEDSGVFSPKEGLVSVALPTRHVDALWDELVVGRARVEAGTIDARPAAETCRFCPIRAVCDVHWEAVDRGVIVDAARGRVLRRQRSSSGQWTVELETVTGPILVGQLRDVPEGASEGVLIALLELSASADESSNKPRRANRVTRVEIMGTPA